MNSEKTLLIVDDSRVSRMMIRHIAASANPNWAIIEASDANQALQDTGDTQVDFMTIDYNMPGMDGLELSEELLKRFPDARASLLTANVQDSIRQRANAAGITFIPKPITENKILGFLDSGGR